LRLEIGTKAWANPEPSSKVFHFHEGTPISNKGVGTHPSVGQLKRSSKRSLGLFGRGWGWGVGLFVCFGFFPTSVVTKKGSALSKKTANHSNGRRGLRCHRGESSLKKKKSGNQATSPLCSNNTGGDKKAMKCVPARVESAFPPDKKIWGWGPHSSGTFQSRRSISSNKRPNEGWKLPFSFVNLEKIRGESILGKGENRDQIKKVGTGNL